MIDEALRHRLHGRFEELLGADEASAVMTALRFEGLATTDDVNRLDVKIDRLDARIDRLAADLSAMRTDVARLEERLSTGLEATAAKIVAELRGESVSRPMLFAILGAMLTTALVIAAVMQAT
jgi:outer membrane murein-binding lipoprotein Lpp